MIVVRDQEEGATRKRRCRRYPLSRIEIDECCADSSVVGVDDARATHALAVRLLSAVLPKEEPCAPFLVGLVHNRLVRLGGWRLQLAPNEAGWQAMAESRWAMRRY